MARVLVYTPTYNDLLQRETVESVEALRFREQHDWVLSDENPYPGRDMRNCVFQFQKGRRLALDGDYDALLLVEHDMIVPPDALQRLWDTDAPVVYGTYQLRHGMRSVNLFQWLDNNRNLGMSLSLYPRELRAARRRGWVRVSGAGFGCLLIKQPVLGQIAFRETGNAPDLPYASDCVKQGITQIGRTDVECGHIDTDTGVTLWPFQEVYGIVARVLAQQDVIVQDEGKPVEMKKGRYYSIGPKLANDLQRAGYVVITNDADKVLEEAAVNPAAEERETAEAKRKTTRRKRAAGNSDKASSK